LEEKQANHSLILPSLPPSLPPYLDEMKVYKARAFLREQHQGMLLKQLEKLEEKKAELAAQKKEREAARARRRAEGEEEEEEEEEEGGMMEAPAPEPENTGK